MTLRAVGYREGRWWIAHCLELDIVAQGDTPQESIVQLIELIGAQLNDATRRGEPGSVFFPAPSEFWNLYARAAGDQPSVRLPKFPESVESLDYRSLAFA